MYIYILCIYYVLYVFGFLFLYIHYLYYCFCCNIFFIYTIYFNFWYMIFCVYHIYILHYIYTYYIYSPSWSIVLQILSPQPRHRRHLQQPEEHQGPYAPLPQHGEAKSVKSSTQQLEVSTFNCWKTYGPMMCDRNCTQLQFLVVSRNPGCMEKRGSCRSKQWNMGQQWGQGPRD